MKHLLYSIVFFLTSAFTQGAVFTVTTTADNGNGSLRQAINQANQHPGSSIVFNIPGEGPHIIKPAHQLPVMLSSDTTIDGTTQPGFKDTPLIVLNGANTRSDIGLIISGNKCLVKGLTIQHFKNTGIIILGPRGTTTISGCFIGTHETGATAAGNGYGIRIIGSSYNTIGGKTAQERNVISGNTNTGIDIQSAGKKTVRNSILGNYIGVSADGQHEVSNGSTGITLNGGEELCIEDTLIGGPTIEESNIIACNHMDGIFIGPYVKSSKIQGNFLGTNIHNSHLANGGYGIHISPQATQNVIGGTTTQEMNTIRYNTLGDILTEDTNNSISHIDSLSIGLIDDNKDTETLFTTTTPLPNTLASELLFPAESPEPIIKELSLEEQLPSVDVQLNEHIIPQEKSIPATPKPLTVTLSQIPQNILCPHASKQLVATVSGAVGDLFTFNWSDGHSQSNVPSPCIHTVNPASTTAYHVTVTELQNQRIAHSKSETVAVATSPSALLTAATTVLRKGESTTLKLSMPAGTPPFSIRWSDGFSQIAHGTSIERSITPAQSKNYSAVITDVHGCKATTSQIIIQVHHLSPVKLTAHKPHICPGQFVDLKATFNSSSPVTLVWSDGHKQQHIVASSITRRVRPQKTTVYRVVARNASGCQSASAITVVVKPAIKATLTAKPAQVCSGDCTSLQLTIQGGTPPFRIKWADLPMQPRAIRTIKRDVCPFRDTRYSVTVTDVNQCTSPVAATTVVVSKTKKK